MLLVSPMARKGKYRNKTDGASNWQPSENTDTNESKRPKVVPLPVHISYDLNFKVSPTLNLWKKLVCISEAMAEKLLNYSWRRAGQHRWKAAELSRGPS